LLFYSASSRGSSKGCPTGLEPATFGTTIRSGMFQWVASSCKIRISKPIFLLRVAPCCRELRPRWYQSGVTRVPAYDRGSPLFRESALDIPN